ncbi:MAG: 4Fe-4S binding protein [Planctomycetota bacterium]|nr:4Fe-4S binding protein [Planctomycetota bacterium]
MALKLWRKPLDAESVKVERGRVVILEDLCKGCGICIEFCPEEVLVAAVGVNAHGYHPPQVAKPEGCVNCGLCSLICPDFAIFSVPLNETTTLSEKKDRRSSAGV